MLIKLVHKLKHSGSYSILFLSIKTYFFHSSQYHNEYRQHQLNSAIQRSINLSNSVDTTYEETQRDFEKKYNKIREKYNVTLKIIFYLLSLPF